MSKQTAIEELKHEAAALLEQAEKIEKFIPEGLPGGLWATDRNIRVDMPYNPKTLKTARRLLGTDWQMCRTWLSSKTGDRYFVYRHKTADVELVVCMSPDKTGATCRRVQVGVTEVPVYDIVCG